MTTELDALLQSANTTEETPSEFLHATAPLLDVLAEKPTTLTAAQKFKAEKLPKQVKSATGALFNEAQERKPLKMTDYDAVVKKVEGAEITPEMFGEGASVIAPDAQVGMDYLRGHIPVDEMPTPFGFVPVAVDPLKKADFMARARVVDDPTSVLDSLRSHTLGVEEVETLEKVYPQILGQIREGVLEELPKRKLEDVGNQQKQVVKLLMGWTDTDLLSSLQASFQTQDEPVKMGEGKVKTQDPTPGQRMENR